MKFKDLKTTKHYIIASKKDKNNVSKVLVTDITSTTKLLKFIDTIDDFSVRFTEDFFNDSYDIIEELNIMTPKPTKQLITEQTQIS